MGSLPENMYFSFLGALLRMRNVLDKSYSENQNAYFIISHFFPQIMLFMR